MRSSIPIGGPGTSRRRRRDPMRTWPPSSSARPGGRRRAGAGSSGRVPGARGRADARPGAPGATRPGGGTGQAPGRRTRCGARGLLRHGARRDRSTSSNGPGSNCCARRSRSRPAAAAKPRHCCSRPPSSSSRSMSGWPARPTGSAFRGLFVGRLRRGAGLLEVAQAARPRPRPAPPRAARSAARRLGAADHGGPRRRGADAEAGVKAFRAGHPSEERSAGSGSPARRRTTVGRRTLGHFSARSRSPVTPACSASSRSRSTARGHLTVPGRARRRRVAGRGGGDDHRGDRDQPPLRCRGARRVPRPRRSRPPS